MQKGYTFVMVDLRGFGGRVRGTGRRTCRITARYKPRGKKTVTIGSGKATLRGRRRSVLVRVKLNKIGTRLLARRPKGTTIRINLRARDSLGRVATSTRRIKLQLKR